MASPPRGQDATLDEYGPDSGTATHHGEHVQTPIVNGDTKYLKVLSVENIPTKIGDGASFSDKSYDDGRPVTAGSTYSSHLELENSPVAAVLAEYDGKPKDAIVESEPVVDRQLLSRPEVSEEGNSDTAFSFGKAGRQRMDFTGTRKGPANATTGKEQPVEVLREGGNMMDVNAQGDTLSNEQSSRDMTATRKAHTKEKHRKRSKRRYDTAPSEQLKDEFRLSPTNVADETIMLPAENQQLDEDGRFENNGSNAMLNDIKCDQRPHTPVQAPQDTELHHLSDSVHGQLQGDLDATTQQASTARTVNGPALESQPQEDAAVLHQGESLMGNTNFGEHRQSGAGGLHVRDLSGPTGHRLSHSPVPARVSKRKAKATRSVIAPRPAEMDDVGQSTSDIHDWLQIVAYKVHQSEQSVSAKFTAERDVLQAELQETLSAKLALQGDLDNAQQQKVDLSVTIDKQKAKLAAYEFKVTRFKTFVDGLGNDFDALKKEANATRRRSEQLVQDEAGRKAERDALFEQLGICAERSAHLKDRALRTCHDTQKDLQEALKSSTYLEQQLSEKAGLLSEERDRSARLERQLASAAKSDRDALQTLLSNSDAIIKKLYQIYEGVNEDEYRKEVSDIIKNTLGMIEGVNSETTATLKDVRGVKRLVEKLGESLEEHSRKASNEDNGLAATAAFQDKMDKALKEVKNELGKREELIQQNAAHCETIRRLQETLKACNVRIADGESQLSAANSSQHQLKEQIKTLQTKVEALQRSSPPAANGQVELSEAQAELENKAKALETASSELANKVDELRAISTANANLHDELRSLQNQIEELKSEVAGFSTEREEAERKSKAAEERNRAEMAEHIEKFEMQLKTKSSNDLKRLTSERNRLENQVKAQSEELTSYQTRLQHVQKAGPSVAAEMEPQLAKAKNLAEAQKKEIETLRTSLSDLQATTNTSNNVQEKYSTLLAQFSAEKSKLQEAVKEKFALSESLEDLKHAAKDAELIGKQARSEMDKCRSQKDGDIKALERELTEAREASERSTTGLELYKKSCEQAIDDENKKAERQIKALQQQLSTAEDNLQKSKAADQEFRSDVEKAWQKEHQKQEEISTTIKAQVTEAQTQKDEAAVNNKRLRHELEVMTERQDSLRQQNEQFHQRAITAEEKLKAEQRPTSQVSSVSSRLHVPTVKSGVTPTGSFNPMEPPKLRKKVDRNSNTTVEAGPVYPIAKELRPSSRTPNSLQGKDYVGASVVDESQLMVDPFASNTIEVARTDERPKNSLSHSDNDDMLTVRGGLSQQLPHTVLETQTDDRLPSFAAFNSNVESTYAPMAKPASSLRSMDTFEVMQDDDNVNQYLSQDMTAEQPLDDFIVYEDSQGPDVPLGITALDERRQLHDSLSWSHAEKEKYTFRKSFPHPNSGSKIVHANDSQPTRLRPGYGEKPHSVGSQESRLHSSHASREGNNGLSRDVGPKPTSSSPDFIQTTYSAGRKASTYHTSSGSAGKRRLSKSNSGHVADPRLADRKRKPASQIVEGYEHERKKRLNAASISTQATGTSFRSQTQPSIKDLPEFPAMPAGPRSSQYGSNTTGSRSRMRTLGGGSSRAVRGVKKMSKNDEFNARFWQELHRR